VEFTTKMAQMEQDVATLELTLELQGQQLKAANSFIADTSEEFAALLATRNTLMKQVASLDGKEDHLRGAREAE
jgi:hypothetical protein